MLLKGGFRLNCTNEIINDVFYELNILRLTCSSSTEAASGRASEALAIVVERTMAGQSVVESKLVDFYHLTPMDLSALLDDVGGHFIDIFTY